MKIIALVAVAIATFPAYGIDLASCSNPSGKGYYPEFGIVSAKDAGWVEEKISAGITKIIKTETGEYDILWVDARKDIFSATQSGGQVMLLNRGKNVFSILVVHPGKTAEVYTFLKTTSGKLEYIQTLSRAGTGALITKAHIMRGKCEYINFNEL